MQTKSSTENPMRKASALAMLLVFAFPLAPSFIMKNSAVARLARMAKKTRFWLLTSAALLVAALTFSLGQWQMSRAAQKQALMLAIEGQGNESMLNAVDLATFKNLQEAVHRR
eukprot:gene17537-36058_t